MKRRVVTEALSIGVRFKPTDDELILHYLNNKVHGRSLPATNAVTECNLYENEEMWKRKFDETQENCLYFFTKLKKKTERKGSRVGRTAGSGTWKNQKNDKIYVCLQDETTGKIQKVHIASRRNFSFVPCPEANSTKECRWVMHEYRLDGVLLPRTQQQSEEYVLCRVKKKKTKDSKGKNITNAAIAAPGPEYSDPESFPPFGQSVASSSKAPSASNTAETGFASRAEPLSWAPLSSPQHFVPIGRQTSATFLTAASNPNVLETGFGNREEVSPQNRENFVPDLSVLPPLGQQTAPSDPNIYTKTIETGFGIQVEHITDQFSSPIQAPLAAGLSTSIVVNNELVWNEDDDFYRDLTMNFSLP